MRVQRALLGLFAAALSLSGCGTGEVRSQETTVTEAEPEIDMEGMEEWAYLLGHTTPFESANEWDGDRNGFKTEWFKSGSKSGEGEYRDNRRVGPWVFWHENGQKRWEGEYVDGTPEGFERSWYDDGTLQYEGTYKSGLRQGVCAHWRPNGRPLWKGSFAKGRRHGAFTQWNANGEADPRESGLYEHGVKVGG